MAKYLLSVLQNELLPLKSSRVILSGKSFHTTPKNYEVQAAKTKISVLRNKPVTYERYFRPRDIAFRKAFNVWNNTTIEGGRNVPNIVFDDIFIRKFITGTFPEMVVSEIIIKRQHNIIRLAFLLFPNVSPSKLYFLVGYTEEMLGYVLQAPIKLEIQTIKSKADIVYKYI